MSALAPLCWRSVLLVVGVTASVLAWAAPDGWIVNSRGFLDTPRVGALWSVDLPAGAAELDGRSRVVEYPEIEGLAFGPGEELFGVDDESNTLVRVGTTSGFAVPVNQDVGNLDLPLGNHDFGLTFTCDGRLLMSTDSQALGLGLYEVDPATGENARIGDLGAPIVDMTSLGDRVYGIGRGMASDANAAAPNLYLIDTESGRAELVGALGAEAALYSNAGLATDAEGTIWAVTDRRDPASRGESLASQVLRIDPETGRAERVSEVTFDQGSSALVGVESLAIASPGACVRGAGQGAESVPAFSAPAVWVLGLFVAALAALRIRRTAAS